MDIVQKSTFIISKMDCPSEEQMIRLKLEALNEIKHLNFDIPNRKLEVYHTEKVDNIHQSISELKLSHQLENTEDEVELPLAADDSKQRKILWWVLGINLSFFMAEITAGWISSSMGLIADSLDMLADSFVYGLSLLAVGAAISKKKNVAKISGYFQMLLAALGLIEVIRRFSSYEVMPVFHTMIVISFLALIANSISLWLIQRTKSNEAHMQASVIFTSNDIIINAGVIVAGVLVYFTESKYPDLIVGMLIFGIVIQGAYRILKLSR
ncbi:MAG: cation diffusion facilitator family transporter [Reichenbachiella sp.]|uniref:cation diffusion facilitator family transporter n=1 Tax=Reichenbachiella sp. TaxID=2184521 RepID=UPI003298CB7D